MNCPKCMSVMEKVRYKDIEVQRCTGCGGLWFDILDNELLRNMEGSEEIDTGDPETGEKYDKIGKIICPACNGRMIRMVDADQPHIWYESCSECYGIFFDAGEFKDYREKTVLDFFRDLFAKERK